MRRAVAFGTAATVVAAALYHTESHRAFLVQDRVDVPGTGDQVDRITLHHAGTRSLRIRDGIILQRRAQRKGDGVRQIVKHVRLGQQDAPQGTLITCMSPEANDNDGLLNVVEFSQVMVQDWPWLDANVTLKVAEPRIKTPGAIYGRT